MKSRLMQKLGLREADIGKSLELTAIHSDAILARDGDR
jgi:hypothetical protein